MSLHPSTFEYLKPTDEQLEQMTVLRLAASTYAWILDVHLLDDPDKAFILRAHRANAMWVNAAMMRLPDGTPRT